MEAPNNDNSIGNEVGSVPTVLYFPDFITQHQQTLLLNHINSGPVSKWKSLKNRRVQNWGGVVHEKGLLSQSLPPWLMKVTEKINEESGGLFPAPINHVLINEYLPNQGIMAHQDGPAYFPVAAILSLGSPVVMDFTPHSRLSTTDSNANEPDGASETQNYPPFSVLLMPRSLLIFKDTAYSDFLHGIRDSEVQCFERVVNEVEAKQIHKDADVELSEDLKSFRRTTKRVSLTCRLVLKVHKNLFKF